MSHDAPGGRAMRPYTGAKGVAIPPDHVRLEV